HRGPHGRGHAGGVGHRGGRRPAGRPERRVRPRRAAPARAGPAHGGRRVAGRPARAAPRRARRGHRGGPRHRRQGVHGRRRGHRHDVPPRRGRDGAGAPVRGRIGRTAPRVGGGAARRGVAEPAPRRRHTGRSCRRRTARRGCPHPRRVGRCVISPSRQGPQGGASASGWDRITAVGDDASRTPGTGPGPEEPKRGGNRSVNRRAPRPSTRRVSAAARGGTATANSTAARSTPPAPAPAERPASETPEPLDGARVALAEAVARVPISPPARTPAPASELPDDRYLNRELSWLDFNARVLALAEDPSQPLLERAKFLAIFASNLDEFYMVRVAGLKRRDETGLAVRSADGLSPREQLARIATRSQATAEAHARVFLDHVRPELADQGIRILRWSDLSEDQRTRLSEYFLAQVFPVLTPLAVDPAHPFPYISGLSLNLAVTVRDPEGRTERFARVKVPNNVPRLVNVASEEPGVIFLPVEDLIAAHLGELFAGMEVAEVHAFRVTRNADVEVEEDRDEDLLQSLERELARRRFGPPVRLEVTDTMSEHVLELLLRELDVDPGDVVTVPGLLDLTALWTIHAVDRPDLKDEPFVPATHPAFAERETPRSIFATLREGDVLVHHPYDSFSTSVQRFIEQAAADPNVLAIKQTLYRTSGDSPIVDALVDAAAAGKQVVALVEIKARFDEQANIRWARELEKAGVHVVYGLVGLKTHCKTALVVRQEGGQIRRYCH